VNNLLEILLVEDNPADVMLIRDAFEEVNTHHHLNVACDGEDALEFLFKRGIHRDAARIDLVLLDLNLPTMNGDEVLRKIRANDQTALLPVIILSSSNARKDVQLAYQLHANGYIRKSRTLDGIYKAISSLMTFWFEVAELPAWVPNSGLSHEQTSGNFLRRGQSRRCLTSAGGYKGPE
jgi:two-component system, chemotaxis family, response regulator Rcp1